LDLGKELVKCELDSTCSRPTYYIKRRRAAHYPYEA
jgi:hypothetical protein